MKSKNNIDIKKKVESAENINSRKNVNNMDQKKGNMNTKRKINSVKNKNILGISLITILVVIVLVASYVLVVMPKLNKTSITEELAKVEEGEKLQVGNEGEGVTPREEKDARIANWDLSKVNVVYDTANVPVPVPKGYVASGVDGEHTVDTGFVIYEGTESVVGTQTDAQTWKSNVWIQQETRNQWVWVPVYDISKIYGTDSKGKKHGKLYNFDSSGKTANNWTEDSNGVMSITSSSSCREPDIVKSYDYDSYMPNYLTEETRIKIKEELNKNFEMTIESIEKYGGFYIGRYETGNLSKEAKVVKMNEDKHNQTWYTMYEKSKELRGKNNNVITSMIWGCQWDRTLEWLVESGNKTYSEVGSNSTNWGNYYNRSFQYRNTSGSIVTKSNNNSTRIPTGSSESCKANNIYDLAGNVCDLTLEANYNFGRCHRGGDYGDSGNAPADCRYICDPYDVADYNFWRYTCVTLRSPVA